MQLIRRTSTALLAGCAVAGLFIACNLDGNDPSFVGGVGFRSPPPAFDSSIPEPVSECESARIGGDCSGGTRLCELGDHPNPTCNRQLECNFGWESANTPADCVEECPATFQIDRPDGCNIARPDRIRCEYQDEGYTCGCSPVVEESELDAGAEDAQVDEIADAGDNDAGDGSVEGGSPKAYVWRCVRPETQGCPRIRPRLGAACVRPMSCDYGHCVFEDGLRVDCYSGVWVQRSPACSKTPSNDF